MHIFLKRILAGIFDLLLIGYSMKLINDHSDLPSFYIIFSIYFVLFLICHTTFGGIILGIKTSFGPNKTNILTLLFRNILVISTLITFGFIAIHCEYYPVESARMAFILLAIGISPTFFTKRELMIHDIISGCHVVLNRNSFNKKKRTILWLFFLTLMILVVFI